MWFRVYSECDNGSAPEETSYSDYYTLADAQEAFNRESLQPRHSVALVVVLATNSEQ